MSTPYGLSELVLPYLQQVRLVLNRVLPIQEVVDAILAPFLNPFVRNSIKIQRFGRGLLARFRDHRLSYSNFNADTKRRFPLVNIQPDFLLC